MSLCLLFKDHYKNQRMNMTFRYKQTISVVDNILPNQGRISIFRPTSRRQVLVSGTGVRYRRHSILSYKIKVYFCNGYNFYSDVGG